MFGRFKDSTICFKKVSPVDQFGHTGQSHSSICTAPSLLPNTQAKTFLSRRVGEQNEEQTLPSTSVAGLDHFSDTERASQRPRDQRCPHDSNGRGSKPPVPKRVALVSGNMHQDLRFAPPCLFLSHAQVTTSIPRGNRFPPPPGVLRHRRGVGIRRAADQRVALLAGDLPRLQRNTRPSLCALLRYPPVGGFPLNQPQRKLRCPVSMGEKGHPTFFG